ncbi:TIGR03086 family metal-binding protein [Longispora albida]|uniref:TIGR03086 family metal-binding protein n=1 Tax=Longispora albida TaxID=203523 RepID=UPI0003A86027|nr:TIGR03086 family metal-binding protein [Longispora albida]
MTRFLYPQIVTAAATAARLARGVRPEQLGGPSPCGEWDVRTLLNHFVLWTGYSFERRALRQEVPQELIDRDFTAEPGWAGAYAAQLDRAVAAWSDPAAFEGIIDVGQGYEMPAEMVAGMVLKEMVVHGWDVARATGQEYGWPEDVAKSVLHVVEEHGELYRQFDGFAGVVAVPADASTLDRALALSGRDPGWTTT